MTEKERRAEYNAMYRASHQGKAAREKHRVSAKCKATAAAHRAKATVKLARSLYRATPEAREADAAYRGKTKAQRAIYYASQAGTAWRAAYFARPDIKERIAARAKTPERTAAQARYRATPEARAIRATAERRRKYGIDEVAYLLMWERQERKCANVECGIPLTPNTRRCHVDHCHQSGRFRGLLCGGCNNVLGFVEGHRKRIKGLENYLRLHSGGAS